MSRTLPPPGASKAEGGLRVTTELSQKRGRPKSSPLGRFWVQVLAPLLRSGTGAWARVPLRRSGRLLGVTGPGRPRLRPRPPPPARSLPGPREHSIHSPLAAAGLGRSRSRSQSQSQSQAGPGSRRRRGDSGERGRAGRASPGSRLRGWAPPAPAAPPPPPPPPSGLWAQASGRARGVGRSALRGRPPGRSGGGGGAPRGRVLRPVPFPSPGGP